MVHCRFRSFGIMRVALLISGKALAQVQFFREPYYAASPLSHDSGEPRPLCLSYTILSEGMCLEGGIPKDHDAGTHQHTLLNCFSG